MQPFDFTRRFFEELPEIALVLASGYRVLYANRAACRAHGVGNEEVVGKNCYELFGEIEPCQNCPLPEVFKTGKSVEKEIFRCGERAWHMLRAFPMEMQGEVACAGVISRDITATKTAEQAIGDINSRIRNFIERMPIGCILWDENFRVSMWNPAAERIFGYSEDEARGRHPYEIIVPPEIVAETDPVRQRLLKGNDSSHRIGENITKDATRIFCEWMNTPIQNASGEVTAVLSMVQDKSHERQLQNEAIRAAQLATIGQMVAMLAHEINNPINGVINYSQILLNQKERFTPYQGDILEKINREGVRIAKIIRGLLNLSRKPAEVMLPQEIEMIIAEAVALLEPEIKKSGIAVSVDLAGEKPIMCCNPQQIEQVVINILKNAIDALNEGSDADKSILITARTSRHALRKEFVLTIANNGPPIPSHLREKIFEPFLTTKGIGVGTGLGLFISREIMSNHGGTIKVGSSPDGLTEMSLVFPLEPG